MKIREIMTPEVKLVDGDATVEDAARTMKEADVGLLPVGEGDRLIGMITDRDIAVRAAAANKNPAQTKVRDAMTADVKYCYGDDEADNVASNMSEIQLRRLPVLNRDKRLVGIVSLADIARKDDEKKAGEALRSVAAPGGQHRTAAA